MCGVQGDGDVCGVRRHSSTARQSRLARGLRPCERALEGRCLRRDSVWNLRCDGSRQCQGRTDASRKARKSGARGRHCPHAPPFLTLGVFSLSLYLSLPTTQTVEALSARTAFRAGSRGGPLYRSAPAGPRPSGRRRPRCTWYTTDRQQRTHNRKAVRAHNRHSAVCEQHRERKGHCLSGDRRRRVEERRRRVEERRRRVEERRWRVEERQ